MRLGADILLEKYKDNLFVAAYSICRDEAEAQDVVQDTILEYHKSTKQFESEEHLRAWLLRVVMNKAKNSVKRFWWRKRESVESYANRLSFETPQSRILFDIVMTLPVRYREVMHLFYYEDYQINEIAKILHIEESTVKVRLFRARKILKQQLKENWYDE